MSLYCPALNDNINANCLGLMRAGIKTLYAANFGEVLAIQDNTNTKEIDTITMATNPTTSAPYFWYRIAFKKDTAGLINELAVEGTRYINQTFNFAVEGITRQSLEQLQLMAAGDVVLIGVDYEGVAHVIGREGGLQMSSMNYGTGTALGDMYGGEIVFTGAEGELTNVIATGTTIQVWNGTTTDTITF